MQPWSPFAFLQQTKYCMLWLVMKHVNTKKLHSMTKVAMTYLWEIHLNEPEPQENAPNWKGKTTENVAKLIGHKNTLERYTLHGHYSVRVRDIEAHQAFTNQCLVDYGLESEIEAFIITIMLSAFQLRTTNIMSWNLRAVNSA